MASDSVERSRQLLPQCVRFRADAGGDLVPFESIRAEVGELPFVAVQPASHFFDEISFDDQLFWTAGRFGDGGERLVRRQVHSALVSFQ